jgi:peptide/nickel transport system substrate-binding protein
MAPTSSSRRRRRWSALGLAAAVAAPILLAGCSSSGSSTGSSSSAAGGIPVVWSSVAIAANLDPALGVDANSLMFVRNTYEGLMEYAPGSTELRPALATSVTPSADGLTYTAKLRTGVKFHDGTDFNAAAVVASFDRIKGLNQGTAKYLAGVDSWTAQGDDTVIIKLTKPYGFFTGVLPWLTIVSPKAVADHKTAADPWAKDWFASNEDGTGPYKMTSFKVNNRIDVTKFDGYWQPWPADVPTSAAMTQVADPATRIQLLKKGEITFAGGGFSPTDYTSLKSEANLALVVQPSLALRTMALNTKANGPMSDPKFREAIVLSFPYEDYNKYFEGWGDGANGPIPPGMTGYDSSLPAFKQDLTKAGELFKAGGWENSGVKIKFVSVQGASYGQQAGTLLQAALAKFGITLDTQVLPWPQIPPLMANNDSAFDISFLNMSANTNDVTQMLESSYGSSMTAAKGGYNWANITDTSIDKMISDARSETDTTKQNATLQTLTKSILAQNATIFGISPQAVEPVAKQWSNVKYDALYNLIVLRLFYAHRNAS